ncbi:aminotransferase class V-fold PLP-dependent enzyme [Streptomyces sp. NPDC052079]|uniref:aminotransferase class V-fold PLP-dependent enzyme n=1 Tax=Streptomyces sp. NPDC052079 TaxID=3155526 RepID=UPI00344A956A
MDEEVLGPQSGPMETFESLVRAEFTPKNTYLNTASNALLPARTVAALQGAVRIRAEGRSLDPLFADVEACRAAYARLAGVPAGRVAAGATVALHTALIAASLPPGAEVLTAEGDFTSVLNPFHARGDLKVRAVPLERLADSVRPGTALVAVSAAQSADGRIADLAALREAARVHGARTYVDFSQAAGWLPVTADAYDYSVTITFKWLLGPHGAAFLVVPEDFGDLTPVQAGWVAGENPWDSCYGPVTELARSARRFDTSPALFDYVGLRASLGLVEELGVDAIRAHDLALADRFRAGLGSLGHRPVPAPGSPIVSVPGLGRLQPQLAEAGIQVSNRAGNLRASFHVYNTADDVDRLLDALSG